MAGLLVFSAREPKKIVNPAGMTADVRQQSKVQVTNKRSARQCGPRRLFAPRKAPACIGVRQLCRKKIRCWGAWCVDSGWGVGFGVPWGSRQLRCPKVSKGRAESPLVRPQAHTLAWGLTRRLRRGSRAYSPMGRSHFSFGGERKVCKRKPAARRLQRRPAPLRVAGFGLREPFGLSSTSARCAHPPGKSPLMPILMAGLATSRAI